MKQLIFVITFFIFIYSSFAQNVGINADGSQPNGRAMLDIKSTDKGVMFPRMTSAQRLAIPVTNGDGGLMVFDTDKQCLYIYTGMNWRAMPFATEKEIYPVNYSVSDAEDFDQFGSTVAIDGDYAAIGAPGDDEGGISNQGSVYIFRFNNGSWTQHQKISINNLHANARFGSSVAMSNDLLVVGAPSEDVNGQGSHGAVYVFRLMNNQWSQHAKLLPNEVVSMNDPFNFGRSVAVSNNRILVGAPGKDNGSYTNQGAAYLFLHNGSNWFQNNKFIHGEATGSDFFGHSVAIDANRIVIGAPDKRVNNISQAGAAYVFYSANGTTGWNMEQKIVNLTQAFEDHFGSTVAIEGDKILAAAPGAVIGSSDFAGSVGIFVYDTSVNSFTIRRVLSITDHKDEDYFGQSIAMKGEKILVGAPFRDSEGLFNSGSVWFYERTNPIGSWDYKRTILDADIESINFFGAAVAICRQTGRYIIGSYYANDARGRVSFGTLE